MIATVLTFVVALVMTSGSSSPTLAASNIADSGIVVADTTVAPPVTEAEVLGAVVTAAPTTTAAPVKAAGVVKPTPVPTTTKPVATTSAPTTAPTASTTRVSNWDTNLSGISSTATGTASVRLSESSGDGVAAVSSSLTGLVDGNYVVQLSFQTGPVKTGYAACSFVVSGRTTGSCIGDVEVPSGATLLKIFVTTLNGAGSGGAVAEGSLARS